MPNLESDFHVPKFRLIKDTPHAIIHSARWAKDRLKRRVSEVVSEIDELTSLEALKTYKIDSYYHNSGNRDQFPGRFEEAISNPNVTNLELDVIYYSGELVVAHTVGGFEDLLRKDSRAAEEQKLTKMVNEVLLTEKGLNIDVKFNSDEASEKLAEVIEDIPEKNSVNLSGREWKGIHEIWRATNRMERPVVPLYTIDGFFGNSLGRFMREVMYHAKDGFEWQVGTSIRRELVTPDLISALNKQGAYSLVFYVDTAKDAEAMARMGVSGITTNKIHIQEAINKNFKEV